MSRDSSDLYSGLTSVSARKVAEQRKKQKQAKDKLRGELVPDAHLINAKIELERQKVNQMVEDIINPDTPDENVRGVLFGVRLQRHFLKELEQWVDNTLRLKKTSEETDDE